jgi:deoxyhypusine synthase
MKQEIKTAMDSVLVKTIEKLDPKNSVQGFDFNTTELDYSKLFQSYSNMGFQASNLGLSIQIINDMISSKSKIFLGYTSNLVSSGLRDVIKYLVQHSLVDVIVSSAGGIEEDFIKCLGNTFIGSFNLKDSELRKKGLNRIGNLLVPNSNYCHFEDWILPLLDEMLQEQLNNQEVWTPSKIINFLGSKINNEDSIYYWAWKNNIPVYCPGITDGSLGDMIYFHSYKNPGLIIDLVSDIKRMNDEAVFADKTVFLLF